MKKSSTKNKSSAKPPEHRCPACDGTGFQAVTQPVQPGRKIYPAPCKECGGKGRITEAAN
jgi:DnaJ-class molecular chaperone